MDSLNIRINSIRNLENTIIEKGMKESQNNTVQIRNSYTNFELAQTNKNKEEWERQRDCIINNAFPSFFSLSTNNCSLRKEDHELIRSNYSFSLEGHTIKNIDSSQNHPNIYQPKSDNLYLNDIFTNALLTESFTKFLSFKTRQPHILYGQKKPPLLTESGGVAHIISLIANTLATVRYLANPPRQYGHETIINLEGNDIEQTLIHIGNLFIQEHHEDIKQHLAINNPKLTQLAEINEITQKSPTLPQNPEFDTPAQPAIVANKNQLNEADDEKRLTQLKEQIKAGVLDYKPPLTLNLLNLLHLGRNTHLTNIDRYLDNLFTAPEHRERLLDYCRSIQGGAILNNEKGSYPPLNKEKILAIYDLAKKNKFPKSAHEVISHITNNWQPPFDKNGTSTLSKITPSNILNHGDETINHSCSAEIHPSREFDESKKVSFIETFATEFEKTCQFYMFISSGDLLNKPGEVEKLATIATKGAKIIPDLKVSLTALGLPIPLSIDIPSSVAIETAIDVCLFIWNSSAQRQADHINHLFTHITLQSRNDMIYDCANFQAIRFQDQIQVLHINTIPSFAKFTVARIFTHMLKSTSNTQIEPSGILTALRSFMSNFIIVAPEPETIHKSLSEVASAAVSEHQHRFIFKNKQEDQPLQLDPAYIKIPPGKSKEKWTAKAIFERSGIRDENKITYSFTSEDAQKYGYLNATREEAEKRRMTKENTTNVPWYMVSKLSEQSAENNNAAIRNTPLNSQSLFKRVTHQTKEEKTEEKGQLNSKRAMN